MIILIKGWYVIEQNSFDSVTALMQAQFNSWRCALSISNL